MSRLSGADAPGSVVGPELHVHRALKRHALKNDLRAWYLRSCREHVDPPQEDYFKERRQARLWFKELCNNQHFLHVVASLRHEREALNRTISLVGWLKDVQQTVNDRRIPYKRSGRLSELDKLHADGGLRELLFPELDKRLPRDINKRSTTIAGLSDFLGLPSTFKEVGAALRRHAQLSVIPTRPRGAVEITGLLQSWGGPNRRA